MCCRRMGGSQSVADPAAEAFQTFYNALPDQVHDQIESLCEKDDERLLKPHAKAPTPFPPVPVGVIVRLSKTTASTALRMVPRLQKKHYEMIPKRISEIDFWVSFFSHMTAIVQAQAPENLAQLELEEWKGKEEGDEANSFDAAWQQLTDAQRAAVEALAAADSDALLAPHPASPPPFPSLPIGVECFVDEKAAMAALVTVKRLQRKHYELVPKKLDERSFWEHFFMHMTVAIS